MDMIYQVRLAGRDINVDRETWDAIRDHVRSNKWFYVIYMGKQYKYTKDQTFYDRPTRFDFDLVLPWDEEVIDYIYID